MKRYLLPSLASAVALGFLAVPFLRSQNPDPNAVTSQTFRIGGDILEFIGDIGKEVARTQPTDPFSSEPPPPAGIERQPVLGVQEILSQELGIPFPEGTWVRHDPRTGRLEIQHQPAVIAAIQAYLEALSFDGEKQINIRAEIYQIPALAALRAQQLAGPLDNHRPVLESIEKLLEQGKATFVTSITVIARSGQRAKAEDMHEVIYPTEVDWEEDDKVVIPAAFETRNVGTILEVDPVLGPDDYTIDLNISLEHHTTPPVMQPVQTTSPVSGQTNIVKFPEFHAKRIVTQLTYGDGNVKLLGAWRPTGGPQSDGTDVMQVVFLTADIQTVRKIVPIDPQPGQ